MLTRSRTMNIIGGLNSGSVRTITPQLGPELVTNGNMEAGSPPTGWVANAHATIAKDTGTVHGGSASLKMTANDTSGANGKQLYTTIANQWYFVDAWGYGDGVHTINVESIQDGSPYQIYADTPVLAVWKEAIQIYRAADTSTRIQIIESGNSGAYGYLDDVSVKQINFPSCLKTPRHTVTGDFTIAQKLTLSQDTLGCIGFCVNLDSQTNPQNYILVYVRGLPGGAKIYIDTCLAGVYSSYSAAVWNGSAATWNDGDELKVVKAGTSYTVYQNGVKVGVTQTIDQAAIKNNTLHMQFSNYKSNLFLTPFQPISINVDYPNYVPSSTLLDTVVGISDIHVYTDYNTSWKYGTWAAGELDALVANINSRSASAVLLWGDLTDNGLLTDKTIFDASFNNLNEAHIYEQRGNHDEYNNQNIFLTHYVYYDATINTTFIGVYTSTNNQPGKPPIAKTAWGAIPDSELAWLETQMIAAAGTTIMLTTHIDIYSASPTYIQIDPGNGQPEAMALCNKYNVKACFSGHSHMAGNYVKVGVTNYYNGPAAIVAGEGYQVLKFYSDRIEVYQFSGRSPFAATDGGVPIKLWLINYIDR